MKKNQEFQDLANILSDLRVEDVPVASIKIDWEQGYPRLTIVSCARIRGIKREIP